MIVFKMETEMENYQEQYVKSLSEKELQAYLIAKSHLGSSFSLEKSLGFIKWLEKAKAYEQA